MDIELTVRINGAYWSGSAGIKVPELMCQQFEPIEVCNEKA